MAGLLYMFFVLISVVFVVDGGGIPVDPCTLPIAPGKGTAAVTRFGFNTETGCCATFLFGGCYGNANNFKTMELCEKRCPPVNPCTLPVVPGPGTEYSTRFGFNAKTGCCEKFTYGGCDGNANNFETLVQCEKRCPPINPCKLPIVVGHGHDRLSRFGFNPDSGCCEKFIYRGSDGNINNFKTLEQCDKRCPPINPCKLPIVVGHGHDRLSRFGFNPNTGCCEKFIYRGSDGNINNFKTLEQCDKRCPPINPCKLPIVVGHGHDRLSRFGFNPYTGCCEKFIYRGSDGNINNFKTLEQCDKRCPPINPCKLPIVVGHGHDRLSRFGFNPDTGCCEKFIYRGSDGNINNFKTLEQCDKRCPPINPCKLPIVVGHGHDRLSRFGFNPNTGCCEKFIYRGSDGNINNFKTLEQCDKRCPPINPCKLPIVVGHGHDRLSRFGFNPNTGCCEKFIYRGSDGNINNFKTLEQCDKRCPPINPCKLPIVVGHGHDRLSRFGFNPNTGCCEKFIYRGSDGNINNFKTLEQCDKRCPPINPCKLPIVVGHGHDRLSRFGFNPDTGCCEKFIYRGSDGNINNFKTLEQCDKRCPPINPCKLPIVVGHGHDRLSRFGFNPNTGCCEKFIYRGSDGNINNFKTLEQCDKRCPPINPCKLPIVVGHGHDRLSRFGFNPDTGCCEKFIYRGSDGNINNFKTLEQCDKRCPPINPCKLPIVVGHGHDRLSRFGFNPYTGCCEKFIYRGSDGNINNFKTLEQCDKRCPPINPCKLPIVVGYGHDRLSRFGFNPDTGCCEKFIYRGSDGNINNFKTLEQCDKRCPPINPCKLPIVVGHGHDRLSRFGFNSNTGCCEKFIYRGSDGNINNFKTLEQCDKRCPPINPCKLPIVVGHGHDRLSRFGFNSNTGCCEKFIYRGSDGNINNFKTLEQCDKRCRPINPCKLPIVVGHGHDRLSRFGFNPDSGCCEKFIYRGSDGNINNFKTLEQCDKRCPPINPCKLPIVVGHGHDRLSRFGFNPNTGCCEKFIYRGSDGNINNFKTLEQCDKRCPPINPCTLPIDVGPCKPIARIRRYGFKAETGRCVEFSYGGCLGNANNFETLQQCDKRCPPINPCSLPIVSGPCKAKITRFGYDPNVGQCVKFDYGGCKGNINNFETMKQCDNRCPPIDPCIQPIVHGPCHGKHVRYAYNETSGLCQKFEYGGCKGNFNNFETYQDCESTCVDPCTLPRDNGSCKAYVPRYFYNECSGHCEKFIFGGCGGNSNNFKTIEQCEETCRCDDKKKK